MTAIFNQGSVIGQPADDPPADVPSLQSEQQSRPAPPAPPSVGRKSTATPFPAGENADKGGHRPLLPPAESGAGWKAADAAKNDPHSSGEIPATCVAPPPATFTPPASLHLSRRDSRSCDRLFPQPTAIPIVHAVNDGPILSGVTPPDDPSRPQMGQTRIGSGNGPDTFQIQSGSKLLDPVPDPNASFRISVLEATSNPIPNSNPNPHLIPNPDSYSYPNPFLHQYPDSYPYPLPNSDLYPNPVPYSNLDPNHYPNLDPNFYPKSYSDPYLNPNSNMDPNVYPHIDPNPLSEWLPKYLSKTISDLMPKPTSPRPFRSDLKMLVNFDIHVLRARPPPEPPPWLTSCTESS